MFRLFRSNSLLGYVLLLPLLVLMNMRHLLQPPAAAEEVAYTAVWDTLLWFLPTAGLAGVMAKLVVLMLIMYIVNALVSVNRFTEHQCALGGMFFALLSGAIVQGKCLIPLHIFSLFGVISLYRLFGAAKEQKPMRCCFAATAWYMLGCFLWAKGVWFLPFFWLAFALQRIATLRCIVASLLGALLPCTIGCTYFFLSGNYLEVTQKYFEAISEPATGAQLSTLSNVCLTILLVIMIIAVFGAQRQTSMLKTAQSLNFRTLVAMGLFAVAAYFTPYFAFSTQMPVAIVGAVFLAAFLQRESSPLRAEIATLLVAIFSLIAQWSF